MDIFFLTRHFNKFEQSDIIEALEFYGNILLNPRTARVITIEVDVDRKLDVAGEVYPNDDCERPREFRMTLRKGPDDNIFQILAHEMVHVKQYATNESYKCLVMHRGKTKLMTRWRGQYWKPKAREDSYYDSPWEIEAYGREVGLYNRWVEHYERQRLDHQAAA